MNEEDSSMDQNDTGHLKADAGQPVKVEGISYPQENGDQEESKDVMNLMEVGSKSGSSRSSQQNLD